MDGDAEIARTTALLEAAVVLPGADAMQRLDIAAGREHLERLPSRAAGLARR